MRQRNVDVAIIGAGTAGLNARREVEKAGKEYVLIERGPLGTTCARTGCMPSKLLIAAANAAHKVATADEFGIDVREWDVDGRSVMQRVRRERDRFVSGVVDRMDVSSDRLLRGEARFVGPQQLRVGDDIEVTFNTAVIATGASAFLPPVLDEVADEVLTTETIFELVELPASLAVFGTGIIAVELGQALHRLGVEVHFFNPYEDDLLGAQDPNVKRVVREIFGAELNLHTGVETTAVSARDGAFVLQWSEDGREHERSFERILAAAGRLPNLKGLGLDAAGIQLDDRGRPVDWSPYTTRIEDSRLFLAGDATNYRPLLHEASDEGVLAGQNAARYPEERVGTRRTPLAIVFTDPNVAFVGARFAELDEDETVCGEASFDNQGRARVANEARGIIRLYANGEGELLGAELAAPAGEHLAHLLAWACSHQLTASQLLRLPVYHPTVEEGLRTAVRSLARNLEAAQQCPPEDLADAPGV